MIAPGITDCGSASQRSSVPSSQTMPPLPLANASEYLNSATSPALRPTTPNRFGPCRGAPSAAATWQVPQDFLNCVSAAARSTPSAHAARSRITVQPAHPMIPVSRIVHPLRPDSHPEHSTAWRASPVLAAYYGPDSAAKSTGTFSPLRAG